jgi:hypothetical protein
MSHIFRWAGEVLFPGLRGVEAAYAVTDRSHPFGSLADMSLSTDEDHSRERTSEMSPIYLDKPVRRPDPCDEMDYLSLSWH